MPPIKHWFPVSHDINADPEVWELTDTFGDWLLFAWLDILSVTDRAEGEYMGTPSAIARHLAKYCIGLRRDKDSVRRRFKGKDAAYRAELALYWMTLRRWLLPILITNGGQMVLESWPNHARMVAEWYANGTRMVGEWWPNRAQIVGFKTRNWAKYHRTRVTNVFPPNHPNQTIPYQTIKNPPNPPKKRPPKKEKEQVVDLVFERFWDQYPKKEKKQLAYKSWCVEAKHCKEIQDAIFAALDWQIEQPQWLKDDGQYIPHPTTWLNQKRWEDKPREVKSHGTEPKGFAGLREWAKYREQK